ncbi:hypothetical protein F4167_05435 [Candidatus Poribacteria bacterium]|nr:hypothetical protein [Candidatus Poribacteria bacterium]
MLQSLFYLFALFFIVCGVIVLFGFFGNHLAPAAETDECPPRQSLCVPDTKPPDCERETPDCPKSLRIITE